MSARGYFGALAKARKFWTIENRMAFLMRQSAQGRALTPDEQAELRAYLAEKSA